MSDRAMESGWTVNRATHGLRGPNFTELWQYRELALFLALRDIKVRYKQAAFGIGWALLQPLLGMAVFIVVFDRLAKVPSEGLPYPVFAYVGLAAWTYISSSVTREALVLVENASLVTKIYFPRVLAPFASALPGLLDLCLSLSLLIVLIPIYGVAPEPIRLLSVPLWMLLLVPVSLSIGLWLSALNVRFRDVNHAVPLFVQLWLFISPVAYSSSSVPRPWSYVYALNPTVGVIDGMKWSLLGARWPGIEVGISFISVAVMLLAGWVYFQQSERRFADVI